MEDKNNSSYLDVRHQTLQPGSLATFLAWGDDEASVTEAPTELRFHGERTKHGQWDISCKMYKYPGVDYKAYNRPLFSGVHLKQKNQVMEAIRQDVIRGLIYQNPQNWRKGVESINCEQEKIKQSEAAAMGWVVPKIITTKQVLFPQDIDRSYDNSSKTGGVFDYAEENISDILFRPKHLSEAQAQLLHEGVKSDVVYPVQFVSVHTFGGYDPKDRLVYFGNCVAKQFEENNRDFGYNNCIPISVNDCWKFYLRQPHGSTLLWIDQSLQAAIESNRAFEQEFILPRMEKDYTSSFIDEKLSKATGYNSTHYSNINLSQARLFDKFQTSDYKMKLN